MVQAYVLVQTEVGKAGPVAAAIAAIDGVITAEDVIGPYEVIARVQADAAEDLGPLVLTRIQGVAGVTRTVTCMVVHP